MVREGSDIDHPCAKDVGYNWFKSPLYLVLVKREAVNLCMKYTLYFRFGSGTFVISFFF